MIKKIVFMMTVACMGSVPTSAQHTHRLDLQQLFTLIEQNNNELRSKKTGIDIAEEGVKAARSQQLPDISTSISGSFLGNALLTDRNFSNAHGLHSPHFGNQFTLDATQVVYAGGALSAGIASAKIGAEQARLGVTLSRENQRLIALGQYLDLEKLANRGKVLEQNIELTRQLIENIKARYEQGVALKNDITRYELQLQTLRLQLTKVNNLKDIQNHQLCNTIGLPNGDKIVPIENAAQKEYTQDSEAH